MPVGKILVSSVATLALWPLFAGAARAATDESVRPERETTSQAQARDPRPGDPGPVSRRETEILGLMKTTAPTANLYLELATLQEARKAPAEAEQTLSSARAALPGDKLVVMALAVLYGRMGRFDQKMTTLEQAAAMSPADTAILHLIAASYHARLGENPALPPETRLAYARAGVGALDRALLLAPESQVFLSTKITLLRQQAGLETDEATRAALVAESNQLISQLMARQQARAGQAGGGAAGPVAGGVGPGASGGVAGGMAGSTPGPFTGGQGPRMIDGLAPVRVGGNVRPPTKLKDVRATYPAEAQFARVMGMVILEIGIDTGGNVADARVLRSIPMLDQAALDAVRQWQFTTTTLNGAPVPVIMTVTVNFTMQ